MRGKRSLPFGKAVSKACFGGIKQLKNFREECMLVFCFQEIHSPPLPPSKTQDVQNAFFLIQPSLRFQAPFGSENSDRSRSDSDRDRIERSIEKFRNFFKKLETLSLRSRHLNMAIKSVDFFILFLIKASGLKKALSHLDFVVGKIPALGLTNMFQFKRSLKKSTLRQYKSE